MTHSITPLFALYILTPGRRIYALRRVLERVTEESLAVLGPALELAITHDRKTRDLEAARFDRATIEVREHDGEVDRTLATIHNLLSYFAGGNKPTAATLLGALFPNGLSSHVHLAHIEQASANERVLEILEGETHADWLDKHGLRPLIEDLRTHHDAFEAALKARDAESVPSWDDIKLARDQGQELYLEVVALIIAHSRTNPELRDSLLEPIRNQHQRIQQYRKQRRSIVDVNPDTGEELEPGNEPTEEGDGGSDQPVEG